MIVRIGMVCFSELALAASAALLQTPVTITEHSEHVSTLEPKLLYNVMKLVPSWSAGQDGRLLRRSL